MIGDAIYKNISGRISRGSVGKPYETLNTPRTVVALIDVGFDFFEKKKNNKK